MSASLEIPFILGVVLSMVRIGAFVVASPILSRAIPTAGRIGFALAVGYFFAEPVPAALDGGNLFGLVLLNVGVGVILGFLTGILFALFEVAGSIIDFTSALSAAAVFNPMTGDQAAVFGRLFQLGALAIFLVIGGDHLMVSGLGLSVQAIPLDGAISLDAGLGDTALSLLSAMFLAAFELTMPVVAALFLAELALGLAARFSPQANVFILGLPVKILVALATVSMVALAFPEAGEGVLASMHDTFILVLRGLSPTETAAISLSP